MTSVDLDALIAALDPEGRGGRRHVDDVATAIRDLVDHVEAASIPQLALDTIRRGENQASEGGCSTNQPSARKPYFPGGGAASGAPQSCWQVSRGVSERKL